MHTPTATEIGMRSKAQNGEEKEIQREYRKEDNTTEKSFRADTNVPNSNSRRSIGENEKYKQGGTPLTMAVKMYPTPTAGCEEGGEQSNRVEQTKSGGFVLRKKN